MICRIRNRFLFEAFCNIIAKSLHQREIAEEEQSRAAETVANLQAVFGRIACHTKRKDNNCLPWPPPTSARLSSTCWRPPSPASAATDVMSRFHEAGGGEDRDKARLYSGEPVRARAMKYDCNFDPSHGA